MSAVLFIALFVIGIFVYDAARRWWKMNEWKRRWRDRRDESSKRA